jgi:glycosyltransferase involved in cell wall biosynthesis
VAAGEGVTTPAFDQGSGRPEPRRGARVVIGAILFNHGAELREALDSLLGQTFRDFALLLVDDGSTDETAEIAREYAALDSRVTYHANPQRLGMIGNSQRAFALAREMHPGAPYFAWASDHDLWHPRWLEHLVGELDAYPEVVLAYPLNRRIGPTGEIIASKKPWTFETFGITDRHKRLRRGIRGMSAGNMVYGLYRADALKRAGIYRHILVPDRLLFTELSLYGQFRQVPHVLWFRRSYGRLFSLGRQRGNFFPGGRPFYAYAPWWISHAISLFLTLTVRGEGRPYVSRRAGLLTAVECLMFSGVLHFWQRGREFRTRTLDRSDRLRQWESRARLGYRAVQRRLVRSMKHYRNRTRHLATEMVRRPGLLLLKALRAIPVVRDRVVPSLLRQELDQIPAAPAADSVKRDLRLLRKTEGPILIGPWMGEVGFELLYWIPFLNWALKYYQLDGRRLIVVSRGGARHWYRHLSHEYLDIFDLYSMDEYRRANEERWGEAGHQKQYTVEAMDRDVVARAKRALGLERVELLHPSLMYRLLRFYWFEKAGVGLLTQHTEYRRLAPIVPSPALNTLPREYIAARFYFRPSFPDTPENRQFAAGVIRSISRETPVVLLNTGLKLDEHDDLNVPGAGIYHVDRLMTPERNLEIQTEIISRARGFVGTYGGLSYVGPFYGVPSVGFYSTESELIPAHLDVSWRLGRTVGTAVAAVDTRAADLLRTVLGLGATTEAAGHAAPLNGRRGA